MSEVQVERDDFGIFLRSVNLELDSEDPGNLEHFKPTQSSITLLSELAMFERSESLMLHGAYGTGKSLQSAVALHWIENESLGSKKLTKQIAERLKSLNGDFGSQYAKRARSKKRGLAIVLNGHIENIAESIQLAVANSLARTGKGHLARGVKQRKVKSLDDALKIWSEIVQNKDKWQIDKILFLWDEFGRHLEKLVEQGRTSDLNEIQTVAEFVVRQKKTPSRFVLVLHQSFDSYNTLLTDSSRSEWKKIEGRFTKFHAGQDGFEMYELMQQVVGKSGGIKLKKADLASYIKTLKKEGIFKAEKSADLRPLFEKTPNIDPMVYYLLPKIAARLSQNERTTFSFMSSVKRDKFVNLIDVFEFFESTMVSDITVGGTSKLYQHTKFALLKSKSVVEDNIIKVCALLSIDVDSKTRLTRGLLETVVSGIGTAIQVKRSVSSLIKRNILIHRKHNDEIIIWHGADINLRADIKNWIEITKPNFDFFGFLRSKFPLQVWRPGRHNDEVGIQRYFSSEFVSPSTWDKDDLLAFLNKEKVSPDGIIYYSLNTSVTADSAWRALIEEVSLLEPRIVFVIPEHIPQVYDLALEISAIEGLIRDYSKRDIDPASLEELRIYLDDAVSNFFNYMQRIFKPGNGQKIIANGQSVEIDNGMLFREYLSEVCNAEYCNVPKVFNGSINKQRPSGVMINARKKLVARMLENSDQPDFGLNNPDGIYEYSSVVASLFRTTLQNPGFYISKLARFATPDEMDAGNDSGAPVWRFIDEFFSKPCAQVKSVFDFVEKLKSPPFGVRDGLLPIFFAAGIRAFSTCGILMKSGEFVEDIKPSDIEDVFSNPSSYTFQVVELSDPESLFLVALNKEFCHSEHLKIENDALRSFAESVEEWQHSLPKYTQVSAALSKGARLLRSVLFDLENPATVVTEQLPTAYGIQIISKQSVRKLTHSIQAHKNEVDSFYRLRSAVVLNWICSRLSLVNTTGSVCENCSNWASGYLSVGLEYFSPPLRALLNAMKSEYESDEDFIKGVTATTTESIDNWSDRSFDRFKFEFSARAAQIFEGATEALSGGKKCPIPLKDVMAMDLKNKIEQHISALKAVCPGNEIADYIESLLEEEVSIG